MRIALLCGAMMPLLFTATAQDAPDLRIDAAYRIVIAASATPAEVFAAAQLKTYLDDITGMAFAVVPETAHDGSPAIHLGPTRLAAAQSATPYDREEYHLKAVGRDLLIMGGRPRGVLFGAFEFLERFGGVRFLSIDYEHVPKAAAISVPGSTDRRHTPAFIYRDIYPGHADIPVLYRRKVRQNSGGGSAELGFSESYGSPRGVHSMHIYSSDFPREISWMNKNGTRQVVSTPHAGSICFSQPEALDRFTAKVKDYVRQDRARCAASGAPYPVFYVVDMNDCNVECFCPECQTVVRQHDVSGLVINFMNALWDRVSGDFPDIYLMMFAYHDSTTPPASGLRPKGNVIVRLAYMDHEFAGSGKVKRDVLFPLSHPNNKPYDAAMTAWHHSADHLAIWDYWKLFRDGFQTPVHNLAAIPSLVRRYRDIGAKHFFVEMELGTTVPLAFFDLRYYLGAKMMNDPDLDPDSLVDEYMTLFYGKAAPAMREFMAYTGKRMAEMDAPLGSVPPDKRPFLDAAFFTTLYGLLDQAEQAATGNPPILDHIGQERLIVDHAYLYLWDSHTNPLGLDAKALRERVAAKAERFGRKYFPRTWAREREPAIEFLCNDVDFPKTGAVVAAKPLGGVDIAGRETLELNASELDGGFLADDPEAFGGKAKVKDSDGKPDYHMKPFTYGIYDWKFKRHLSTATLAKAVTPQDEKYHWYYAGRTRVYSTQTRLWTHWSWTMNFSLGKALQDQNHKQLYDVYLSAKLQGPSYVQDSRKPDEVRVDRVILLKANPTDPVPGT